MYCFPAKFGVMSDRRTQSLLHRGSSQSDAETNKSAGHVQRRNNLYRAIFLITIVSLHQKSRVSSAEPKGIRQHISHLNAPRSVRHIIKIAIRVGLFVVGGRRHYLIVQCQRADSRLYSSRRSPADGPS